MKDVKVEDIENAIQTSQYEIKLRQRSFRENI